MGLVKPRVNEYVIYNNCKFKISKILDYNLVQLLNENTNENIEVKLEDLVSSIKKDEKKYIDDYTDSEWKIALERYEIIKDLVFTERTKNDVEEVAREYGYSSVTLYKWIKLFEQTNEKSSLIPKTHKRGRKGNRLDASVENIITEILEELYLNKQRYSFRRIYIKIYTKCKLMGLEAPHENTIRNRIDSLDPKRVVKRRHGYKEAEKQFKNFEGEFPEGNYPLEFVQIDHTPLDIRVVDNIYREVIGRPYLTLAIDVYSRMIVGFYLSLHSPGYFNVSQCLYNIFTQKDKILSKYEIDGDWNIFGIPRIIGVDNGTDLVSSDMQRVCEEYNITLMKRPVARPQFGAHIERVLGTINQEVHNLPGTTFSNINEKGNYKSDKEAMYTLEELTQWLLQYIVNIYHKRYHNGIEMTPEQKLNKGIFGDDETAGIGYLPSIIEDLESVRISLLPTEYRTIQKDGITLDGISYYSDVLRHWIGKKDSNNSNIKHKIKRDPLNIQKIYFYDPEIKEYFEVPYRKLYGPMMNLWDLKVVKKYIKDRKVENYNEDDIFEAYEELSKLEEKVKNKHKYFEKNNRKNQSEKITQKSNDSSEELPSLEQFDSLFENIKFYNVTSKDNNE